MDSLENVNIETLLQRIDEARVLDQVIIDKWSAQCEEIQRKNSSVIGDKQLLPPQPRLFHTFNIRRKVRYRIFRIRDGGPRVVEYDHGLKNFIEKQFAAGMNWAAFTFDWDVAAHNPLQVIRSFEWISSGGKIDKAAGLCDPPAFTRQDI